MKTEVGLWIDHRQAIVVIVTGEGEETRRISSNIVQFSGSSRSDGYQKAEDMQDRRYTKRLSRYYDEVIACLRDADSILIFGPGEAKGELQKQLEGQAFGERIVGIETTDNMTDGQVAAKVREHFQG